GQCGDGAGDTAGMTVEVAMDPRLQDAAEVALRESLRAIDKRQGWRGPEVRLGPERLDAYRTALARRLSSIAQTPDQAWVLDLEGIYTAAVRRSASKPPKKRADETEDADTAADAAAGALEGSVPPDVLARAAKARPLAPNEIYSGLVTSVGRADAVVELAPGIAGNVPFSTMAWARPFKPERATPPPRAPGDVLAVGDVVAVRVAHLQTQRTSAGTRVQRLELALEQTPKVEGAFVAMDLKTRGVLALAVKRLLGVGRERVRGAAKAAGLSSEIPQSYTAALGTGEVGVLEQINAFATLASEGRHGEPVLIRKVLSRDGNTLLSDEPK